MRRTSQQPKSRRSGLTLAIVLAVLSMVVLLAIAFLQSQASALRIAENGRAADQARRAAETGIAAALDALQDPLWLGVSVPLTAEVHRDGQGTASYTVTFDRVSGNGTPAGAANAALRVRIRSTGTWQLTGIARATTRDLETTVVLSPRLPDRPARSGDIASATDRSPDAIGFNQAQQYAAYAANGSDSFFVCPQTRVAGDAWVADRMWLYDNLNWSSTQRAAVLTGLGTDNGGGTGAASPHPLAGSTTFYTPPNATQSTELTNNLKNPAPSAAPTRLAIPAFDPTRFRRYRLFAGGFEYDAVELSSTLLASQNAILQPTDSNPLGIFYCNGGLTVEDNVVVKGTLVASGGVTFNGRGIAIKPFDWRDGSGGTSVLDRDLWPLLPAVVAGGQVTFNSSTQTFIDGTVISAQDVIVSTPDLSTDSALLNYDGNATAEPRGNGLSRVQVTDVLSLLSGLTIDQRHAVQFRNASGQWGEWFPVVTSNTLTGVFDVHGTVEYPSPKPCRFRPRRRFHTDILGPVIGGRIMFANPPVWSAVSSAGWTAKYNSWQDKRNGILGILLARPSLTFSASLAEDGFPFEPTVRIARPQNVKYACEPPLFRPDPASRSLGGGYRWEVDSWQEVSQ